MITTLKDPPTNTISDASYVDDGALVVSSWDQYLRLYNTKENRLIAKVKVNTPILNHACMDSLIVFGGLDSILYIYDPSRNSLQKLYKHKSVINNVCYQSTSNLLFTSDWNNVISIFDNRTKNGVVYEVNTFGFIYSIDVNNSKLLACDSSKRVYIFDTCNGLYGLNCPDYRDNILRYQFRCIKCFPNQKGFAISSVEGRVAWEYFKKDSSSIKNYSFRCHRLKNDNLEIAYAINTIDFHPVYETFCTGGSDGIMCAWDGINRKRIWRTPNFNNEITKVTYNTTGDEICICASSYFDNSSCDTNKDHLIHIRKLQDKDIKSYSFNIMKPNSIR